MLTHFGAASLKRHVRDVRFRAQQTHVIQTEIAILELTHTKRTCALRLTVWHRSPGD